MALLETRAAHVLPRCVEITSGPSTDLTTMAFLRSHGMPDMILRHAKAVVCGEISRHTLYPPAAGTVASGLEYTAIHQYEPKRIMEGDVATN